MTTARERGEITPGAIGDTLARIIRRDITCEREGDGFVLDTPYVLSDGHLLEVYLERGTENGDFIVSDRGYATEQIDLFVKSAPARNARYTEMRQIAHELGMEWDADFSYQSRNLTRALEKMAILAQGVDRALSLTSVRAGRQPQTLDRELAQQFRGYGIGVKRNSRIQLREGGPTVNVGFHLMGKQREAAVEVLSGETYSVYDHASANFAILKKGNWQGLLFAIYDEEAEGTAQLDRFRYICDSVPLLKANATEVIRERLAA